MATPAARTAGPATAAAPQLTTCRWSSSDEADRVPVEDPATGEVIAVVQGGGPDEVDAAVEAAHRAFETDWRWRTWAERATLLLRGAEAAWPTSCRPTSTTWAPSTPRPTLSLSAWLVRSSLSTGLRSTPVASSLRPSPSATPSS